MYHLKNASMYFFPVKIDFFPLIEYESICYRNTVPPIRIKNGALIDEIIFNPAQFWNLLVSRKKNKSTVFLQTITRKPSPPLPHNIVMYKIQPKTIALL